MSFEYPIGAAAKATGLTVETLRAWERRYNAVVPVRTERGRVYGDAEIRRLQLLRRAVESGRSISQVANLSDADLEELAKRAEAFEPKAEPEGREGVAAELLPLVEALHAYSYSAMNEELTRLALLLRHDELVYRVVLPLMRYAGDSWEKGIIQVAHEHMLSACVRNLLGGMVRLQRAEKWVGTLLLTTPAMELHEFGILLAAMLAVGQGFDVVYLGPNMPAREIAFAAERTGARAVALGLTTWNAPAAKAGLGWLAGELPAKVELWLGGTGAAEVVEGIAREGVLMLEDLMAFERHLVRLAVTSLRDRE